VTRCRSAATERQHRRGVSLIEVLIACVLLTVAVLGLVGASTSISKQTGNSRRQVIAAGMAMTRLDSLRSIACTAMTNGTATRQGITESWTVSGTGATRTIVLNLTLPRLTNPIVHRVLVPCV
jgi:Tfp pilus assembly protein PilV